MEQEKIFSGYCRQLDSSRIVEVILEDGEITEDRIPKNGIFTVLARWDEFLLVSYEGLRGYVLENRTEGFE